MYGSWKFFMQSAAFRTWCVVFLSIAAGYFVLEKLNGRDQMADFRVYHDAASAWTKGEPMYGQAFGVSSGYYKYSPIAAAPFILFTLARYPVTSALYYIFIAFAFLFFTATLLHNQEKLFGLDGYRAWFLVLFSLFVADHMERELHLGNVNLFLLCLGIISFLLLVDGKKWSYGLVFGIMLLYKPHFVVLLPWLVWRKEWKAIGASALVVVSGLLVPSVFIGWKSNAHLLGEWVRAIQSHNVRLQDSPNTVYGILESFVFRPLGHGLGSGLIFVVLAVICALVLFWLLRTEKHAELRNQRLYIEYFVLIALIPNLAHTDTEHFMWSFPIIAFLLGTLLNIPFQRKWIYIFLTALAFIPYCLNSPDIVGRKLTALFDEGGLLGISNLLLIGLALTLFSRLYLKKNSLAREGNPDRPT